MCSFASFNSGNGVPGWEGPPDLDELSARQLWRAVGYNMYAEPDWQRGTCFHHAGTHKGQSVHQNLLYADCNSVASRKACWCHWQCLPSRIVPAADPGMAAGALHAVVSP